MNTNDECQKCYSKRLAFINAKSSDLCDVEIPFVDFEKSGYLPHYLGIGGNNDVDFAYCLDCGQIQGNFPITLPENKYCPNCGVAIEIFDRDKGDLIKCTDCFYEDDYEKFLDRPPKTEEEKEKDNIEEMKNVDEDPNFWENDDENDKRINVNDIEITNDIIFNINNIKNNEEYNLRIIPNPFNIKNSFKKENDFIKCFGIINQKLGICYLDQNCFNIINKASKEGKIIHDIKKDYFLKISKKENKVTCKLKRNSYYSIWDGKEESKEEISQFLNKISENIF